MKITKKAYIELIQQDLDFLNKHLPNMGNSLELDHIKSILTSSVDRFYKIEASRWRKVSEELPESDQLVLVKMDFGEGYYYDIGRYDCNDKMFYSEAFVSDSQWNSLDDVIEWKPID